MPLLSTSPIAASRRLYSCAVNLATSFCPRGTSCQKSSSIWWARWNSVPAALQVTWHSKMTTASKLSRIMFVYPTQSAEVLSLSCSWLAYTTYSCMVGRGPPPATLTRRSALQKLLAVPSVPNCGRKTRGAPVGAPVLGPGKGNVQARFAREKVKIVHALIWGKEILLAPPIPPHEDVKVSAQQSSHAGYNC